LKSHDAPDLSQYRADFPILKRELDAGPLIYLDSAATALKPESVISAVASYYTECTSNVRRAVHALGEEASTRFEGARDRIARFINAAASEIVFVRSATEALNLVASAYAGRRVAASPAEHHSNLLPWRGDKFITLDLDSHGRIDAARAAAKLRAQPPDLVAFSTISNALGVRQPVRELVDLAHSVGARVLLDISQSVGHEPVDVEALGCEFACFSGHKMLGPTGVGVLYVSSGCERLLSPVLLGGSMVKSVDQDTYVPLEFPHCMEAGTPNVEGILGLAAACDYLDDVGVDRVHDHGARLAAELKRELSAVSRVKLHGDLAGDTPIVTFSMPGLQAHSVARLLSNRSGIMVRSGFHCAQPLHLTLALPETVRASVHLYNTLEEVRLCARSLGTIAQLP
jgi:cysteine desulfurase/selenocysteine lyase